MSEQAMDKQDLTEQDKVLAAQQEKIEELLTVRYLTPEQASFTRTEGGFVALAIGEEKYDRVNFFRAFPFSDPGRYISVREPDAKAREIGIIKELDQFNADTQALIIEQMNLRYFTPQITRVHDVKVEFGFAYWSVTTDRGPCKFTMNSGSIPYLSDVRLLISDIDGNRFEIKDFTKLPQKDIKKLDMFL